MKPIPTPETTTRPAAGTRGGDKYQRILDAAIHVIARKGYAQARVSDIAEQAGIADGTVYLYFKNKEEILREAINAAFDAFLERARTETHELSDPRERLRKLAHLHLSGLGSNRDLAVVFQTELRHSAKFLSDFSHHHLVEYFHLIRNEIRRGQQSGVLRKDLPEKIAANCFFGALDEMVTSWMLSDREYTLADAADAVVDVILRGFETGHGK